MLLAEFQEEKVIPRNYGVIEHLPGSRMIMVADKLIGAEWCPRLLVRGEQRPGDMIIVTEKFDGANVGVLKRTGLLHPLQRAGYDVRATNFPWLARFADFTEYFENAFDRLLGEGERVCGEWMIKTHTIQYRLNRLPFIIFDVYDAQGKRLPYFEMCKRVRSVGFEPANLLHAGTAITIEESMQFLHAGKYASDLGPEGVMYRLENNEQFVRLAKYVSNLAVGQEESFRGNDLTVWNRWNQKHWN